MNWVLFLSNFSNRKDYLLQNMKVSHKVRHWSHTRSGYAVLKNVPPGISHVDAIYIPSEVSDSSKDFFHHW